MERTPPPGFRYATPMTIRFGDMDAMRHVNNAAYLTYFETARLNYMYDVCQQRIDRASTILAKITVEFKLPLVLGDEIMLFTRCPRLGNKSFELESVIIKYMGDQSALAATSLEVMVFFDYETQATIPVSEAWRARIQAYEPALI